MTKNEYYIKARGLLTKVALEDIEAIRIKQDFYELFNFGGAIQIDKVSMSEGYASWSIYSHVPSSCEYRQTRQRIKESLLTMVEQFEDLCEEEAKRIGNCLRIDFDHT